MSQKKFAVFDIDGTVARTSLFLATVHAIKRRGLLTASDDQQIDTALDKWLRRSSDVSFEEYSDICVLILRKALPSISLKAYKEIVDEVLKGFSHKIYRYTTSLIKDLHAKDYLVFAISGSESFIVERFCREHDFDDWIGNNYEIANGFFTGKVGTTYHDKAQYIDQLINKHGCTKQGSVGVGDTHGDIEMLEYVEKPIAFNPNKSLLDHAKKAGWDIVIERKNVTYRLKEQDGIYILTDEPLMGILS